MVLFKPPNLNIAAEKDKTNKGSEKQVLGGDQGLDTSKDCSSTTNRYY